VGSRWMKGEGRWGRGGGLFSHPGSSRPSSVGVGGCLSSSALSMYHGTSICLFRLALFLVVILCGENGLRDPCQLGSALSSDISVSGGSSLYSIYSGSDTTTWTA
jgi:hypothetical protein